MGAGASALVRSASTEDLDAALAEMTPRAKERLYDRLKNNLECPPSVQLKEAGASLAKFVEAGWSVAQLIEAGFSRVQLEETGFYMDHFKAVDEKWLKLINRLTGQIEESDLQSVLSDISTLLKEGADVNMYKGDRAMIHVAASYNASRHVDIAKLLLSTPGVDLNLPMPGQTYTGGALHEAVSCNALEIVEALINAKANLDIVDNNGCTAVMTAINGSWKESAIMLINGGANLNLQSTAKSGGTNPLPSGCSALTIAAKGGNDLQEAVCEALIESGRVKLDVQDDLGLFPLWYAVTNWLDYGKRRCTEALVKAGAKVDMQTPDGSTVLHKVGSKGRTGYENERELPVTKLLLDAGASKNLHDSRGMTALACAEASLRKSEKVVELLNETRVISLALDGNEVVGMQLSGGELFRLPHSTTRAGMLRKVLADELGASFSDISLLREESAMKDDDEIDNLDLVVAKIRGVQ